MSVVLINTCLRYARLSLGFGHELKLRLVDIVDITFMCYLV